MPQVVAIAEHHMTVKFKLSFECLGVHSAVQNEVWKIYLHKLCTSYELD
jgi:hypothetical protein